MNLEIEFMKLLNLLARVCDFELDKEVIAIYDQKLSPYGYENVNKALKDIFAARGGRDPFPSIAEVVRNINNEASSRSQAENVVSIIFVTFTSTISFVLLLRSTTNA